MNSLARDDAETIGLRRPQPPRKRVTRLTFTRYGFPVPLVELDLRLRRLAHELLHVVRAERRVPAEQNVRDDPATSILVRI